MADHQQPVGASDPPAGAAVDRGLRVLHEASEAAGPGRSIGAGIAAARDAVARGLIRAGATPDRLTIAGFLLTCGAGYCLMRGAGEQSPYFYSGGGPVGWWPVWTGVVLLLAAACDMLDGAVARIGKLGSRSGALLDSSVDRFSDMVIYLGCFLHFALLERPNITYQLLAIIALCNAFLISYVKARAEDIIADCTVGYWQRGERFAGFLIACFAGHIPSVLWIMAVSGAFTVWRRLSFAYLTVRAADAGRPLPPRGPRPGWLGAVQLWRRPRGSVAYDLVTGTNIAFLIWGPCLWPVLLATGQSADPVRQWLGG